MRGTQSERGSWMGLAVRVAVGLVAGLLVTELAVRLYTGFPWVLGGQEGERYSITDPTVGRMPRPGLSMRHPSEGFTMNIGEHGTRLNGGPPRPERPLAIAVGDSFAFGDDVNDDESWPAYLEQIWARRVINGGVPGFGLDQAVLRAEQLAAIYSPEVVVLGFIPHDVKRCEMSYWSGQPKPYFDIEAGSLRWHPAPDPPPQDFATLKRVLSLSLAMDLLFPRFLHWKGPEELAVHRRGGEVACLLMERLAALGRARGARVVVLAHPQEVDSAPADVEIKDRLLACARASGLLTVDAFPAFASLTPEGRARLFRGHLTAEGNRLVATQVANALKEPSAAPR